MNKQLLDDKTELRKHLNERNLGAVIETMTLHRDRLDMLSSELVALKKDFSSQTIQLLALKQEIEILKTKEQLSGFTSGSTIR